MGMGHFPPHNPPPPPRHNPPALASDSSSLATIAEQQHCPSLPTVHSCYHPCCRLGKAGLAVSGKTAAKAAMEAASQVTSLPSVGKKRKAKPAATSPEQAQKKGKKRRAEGATAEEVPSNEASPEQARSAITRRSRPPRPPVDGASTPAEDHKLGQTSEASSHITHSMLHFGGYCKHSTQKRHSRV